MKEKKAREMFEEGCHYFNRIKVQLNIEDHKNNRVKLILPQQLQNGQRELGFIANESKEIDPRKTSGIIIHLHKDILKALNMEKELKKIMYKFGEGLRLKCTKRKDMEEVKRVCSIIENGFLSYYGRDFYGFQLTINQEKSPFKEKVKSYSQQDASKNVSDLLVEKGYFVSRSFQGHSNYYLTISNGKDKANILVRNLQHDPSYKTSPHPVYKIDAFSSRASQNTKYPLLDFIVGYNMIDESFACLPIEQFKIKRSKIVHSKNGQNHEFFQSWNELDHFLRKHAVSQ